jgi:saccharopine dehydrogenase-like NADP-dependent oxidoreductase
MIDNHHFGAIQLTTAAGICAPLDLYLTGKISNRGGFIRCEEISLPDFLNNEFGKHYRDDRALQGLAV